MSDNSQTIMGFFDDMSQKPPIGRLLDCLYTILSWNRQAGHHDFGSSSARARLLVNAHHM